jgi:hypothetical protein
MRRRFAVLAATLGAVGTLAAPPVAAAWPARDHGLTINATPDPIVAGEAVLVYGQLNGPDSAGQTIVLFHRVIPAEHFSMIGVTTTNALGFYEFLRPDGVVLTNRDWFVRGPDGTHSRTLRELVSPLVSLSAGTPTATTGQLILFSGNVSPDHPFERILLQEQSSLTGSGWATIAAGFTGAGSNFVLPHRWWRPGLYTLRAVFPGDPRNIAGTSDTVTVVVQQRQQPGFTINSSTPIIADGQRVTISGTLDRAGATTPEPSTELTLWGRLAEGTWHALATTVTAANGSYSFTQSPAHNTAYLVKTTLRPARATTVLYEGVQDVVTLTASSPTGAVGNSITLGGTVSPTHAGHLIYLQRLGVDGRWHNIAATLVGPGSTFSFAYQLTELGAVQLRARITGGPENIGAASPPVTLTGIGIAPVTTLPPAG